MPEEIRRERPDCPAVLCAICTKMIQKEATDRYATAREVAEALEGWLAKKPAEQPSGAPAAKPVRSRAERPRSAGAGRGSHAPRGSSAARSANAKSAPVQREPLKSPHTDTASNQANATVKGLGPEPRTGQSGSSVIRKPSSAVRRAAPALEAARKGLAADSRVGIGESPPTTTPTDSNSGRIELGVEPHGHSSSSSWRESGRHQSGLGKRRKSPAWLWICGGALAVLLSLLAVATMVGVFSGKSDDPPIENVTKR
jgi:hypothetical protein